MYTEDNFVQIGLTGVHDLSSSDIQFQFNLGLVHISFLSYFIKSHRQLQLGIIRITLINHLR